jgi:uncharacterized membrane-anchored protein
MQLKAETLKHDGLTKIETVFELSWEKLALPDQQLTALLSLFAVAPIAWELVYDVAQGCRVEPISQGWLQRLLSLGAILLFLGAIALQTGIVPLETGIVPLFLRAISFQTGVRASLHCVFAQIQAAIAVFGGAIARLHPRVRSQQGRFAEI